MLRLIEPAVLAVVGAGAVLLSTPATARGQPSAHGVIAAPTGSVEGGAYLRMESGRTVPMSGEHVYLVPASALKQAGVPPLCQTAGTSETDSGEQNGAYHRVTQMVMRGLAGSSADAKTGMQAHFRFPAVSPGRYYLLAMTSIADDGYYWWAPVDVRGGERSEVMLDNEQVGKMTFGDATRVRLLSSSQNGPYYPAGLGRRVCAAAQGL